MKTVNVKITVPKKKEDSWKVSVLSGHGGSPGRRKNAVLCFKFAERKILKLKNPVVDIQVDYGYGDNCGTYFTAKSALYALACFLEDYFNADYRDMIQKRYLSR
jgi:hypothetical protein